jgi:hypothetical protein
LSKQEHRVIVATSIQSMLDAQHTNDNGIDIGKASLSWANGCFSQFRVWPKLQLSAKPKTHNLGQYSKLISLRFESPCSGFRSSASYTRFSMHRPRDGIPLQPLLRDPRIPSAASPLSIMTLRLIEVSLLRMMGTFLVRRDQEIMMDNIIIIIRLLSLVAHTGFCLVYVQEKPSGE